MNTGELLTELRHNILRDVSGAISVDEQDLLWTDPSLLNYLNDGYFRFCRLTEYLQDATTASVVEVLIEEGVVDYPLHQSIIRVQSARLDNLTVPITSQDRATGAMEDTAAHSQYLLTPVPGLFAVQPDYQIGSLRTVGVPSAKEAGKVLRLRVTRYPLEPLSLSDPTLSPELPAHMHLDLLEWAAFRALRNHDADGESMGKASAHSTQFQRAVDEAKKEMSAREFSHMTFSPSWRW